MATIFVHIIDAAGAGITGLTPTLDYWDKSTPATPVTGVTLAELTGGTGVKIGGYFADVALTDGREYLGLVDGLGTSVPRVHPVAFSGEQDARIEVDVPAILVDTDTTIPATLATLETEAAAAARATALTTLLTTTGIVLTGAAITAVWDEDVTGREGSPNSAARILDMKNKLMRGRLRTNPVLNRLELYDPVDDSLLLAWPLTDFAGDPIANVATAPFDRAKAVES